MKARIERHTDRVEPFETRSLEFLPEFSLDENEGLLHYIILTQLAAALDPVQVIEHIEQLASQRRLGPVGELDPLLGGTLAEIVVLGGEADMPVAQFGEFVFQPLDGLFTQFNGKPNRPYGSLGRILRLCRLRIGLRFLIPKIWFLHQLLSR